MGRRESNAAENSENEFGLRDLDQVGDILHEVERFHHLIKAERM
jgi:hypothetical protein